MYWNLNEIDVHLLVLLMLNSNLKATDICHLYVEKNIGNGWCWRGENLKVRDVKHILLNISEIIKDIVFV